MKKRVWGHIPSYEKRELAKGLGTGGRLAIRKAISMA